MAESKFTPLTPWTQDLMGRRFGRLIVLRYVGSNSRRSRSNWLCRCDCGKDKVVCSRELLCEGRSKTRSCGCLKCPPLEKRLAKWIANWESDESDRCWEWTGSLSGTGYGRMTLNQRPRDVHRLVYELKVGPIPSGHFVCHTCDNPKCCNPAHLFVGTPADNMADKTRKGRGNQPRGQRVSRARLTDEKAREIVARYKPRVRTMAELARDYNVDEGTIWAIVTGKTWTHATGVRKELNS